MLILKKTLKLNIQGLRDIFDILKDNGGSPRLIGGIVRDAFLNIKVSDNKFIDVDIATTLLPTKVVELFEQAGYKTIPTGLKHGTITIHAFGRDFEITTLRKDMECYGREAKVSFTDDYKTDAMRRDFTINALSYCIYNEEIYDYCEGIQDLKASKVIFIGDPEIRIREDYLRILRFFRFTAIYAKDIDQAGYSATKKHANQISNLPRERINAELDKIFTKAHDVSFIMSKIIKANIPLLPGININTNHLSSLYRCYNMFNYKISLDAIYSSLMIDANPQPSKELVQNLLLKKSLSNSITHILYSLLLNKIELRRAIVREYLEYKNKTLLIMALVARKINFSSAENLDNLLANNIPPFPINGDNMLQLGFKGKEISNILTKIHDAWIDSSFTLSKQEMINMIHNSAE